MEASVVVVQHDCSRGAAREVGRVARDPLDKLDQVEIGDQGVGHVGGDFRELLSLDVHHSPHIRRQQFYARDGEDGAPPAQARRCPATTR